MGSSPLMRVPIMRDWGGGEKEEKEEKEEKREKKEGEEEKRMIFYLIIF